MNLGPALMFVSGFACLCAPLYSFIISRVETWAQ
jgi:hypothetical protein